MGTQKSDCVLLQALLDFCCDNTHLVGVSDHTSEKEPDKPMLPQALISFMTTLNLLGVSMLFSLYYTIPLCATHEISQALQLNSVVHKS